ncbi:hypothetical protein AbraIFM66951_004828 [Aspergillus brasiliensis]|uniref:Uncharacterized protein n=1 Tax=Aspergillus brasiliensis TaxID=319629 RepID=A0A9W5YZS4_9EURO|nr:hypothetical protein AbraCBS73388_003770 [Aspergillus brasiliensis]GKZ51015.1 hypothetical protein AbraIFM66951_004828 [Aspergillus brasiliensis]
MPPKAKGKQKINAISKSEAHQLLKDYEAATPYIEQLFRLLNNEVVNESAKKLRQINARIQRRNSAANRPSKQGTIDTDFFIDCGKELEKAVEEYVVADDVSTYGRLKKKIDEKVEKEGYPTGWGLDDDEFRNFCKTIGKQPEHPLEYDSTHEGPTSQGYAQGSERLEDTEPEPEDGFAAHQGDEARSEYAHEDELSGDVPDEEYSQTYRGRRSYPEDETFEEHHHTTGHDEVRYWQQNFVPLDRLFEETEKTYGLPFTRGQILAWRAHGNTGWSVIVGYECDGRQIARLEPAKRRPFPKDSRTHIQSNSRGHKPKSTRGSRKVYRSSDDVAALGLVAWRVDNKYEHEPTSVLRPSEKAWYPETYVQVCWTDGVCTWESRDSLRFVFGGSPYKVDILVYRTAIALEGDYQEALTGVRPQYPDGGVMQNQHWRNRNALGGAHWLHPRANKNKRVVSIQEESLSDLEDELEDEDIAEEVEEEDEDESINEEADPEFTDEEIDEEEVEYDADVLAADVAEPDEAYMSVPIEPEVQYTRTGRHFLPTPPASRRQTPHYKDGRSPKPRAGPSRSKRPTAPPMPAVPEIPTRDQIRAARNRHPMSGPSQNSQRDATPRQRQDPSLAHQKEPTFRSRYPDTGKMEQQSFIRRAASQLPSRQPRTSNQAQRGQQSFVPSKVASEPPPLQSRTSGLTRRQQQPSLPKKATSVLPTRPRRPSVSRAYRSHPEVGTLRYATSPEPEPSTNRFSDTGPARRAEKGFRSLDKPYRHTTPARRENQSHPKHMR